MTHPALSEVDLAYLDASRVFTAYGDRGSYLEQRRVAIVSCGLPVPFFNWAFLKPPYDDVRSAVNTVREYFESRQLPFRLTFPARDTETCRRELEAVGWAPRGDASPAMTLALSASLRVPAPSLEVEEVRDGDRLVAFRDACFAGFGFPAQGARMFLNERLLAHPDVRMYAGRVGDQVVATSLVCITGSVAGIYWVATLESHRSKGHGESVTWAAVQGGRERGCRVASLQASQMGFPVYLRMGFEHPFDYAWYVPKA